MIINHGLWNWPSSQTCKLNRKRLDNAIDPSSSPSTPSYSYDRLNENSDSSTNVVLPPRCDTYIKTQCNSSPDAYVGSNYVSSAGLDQSTNHHGTTDGNDNDDSQ